MDPYWHDTLVLLVSPAAVVTALVFLGRKFLDLQATRDIERLKSELALALADHQTKLVAISSTRAEVIAELYALLATASDDMRRLVGFLQQGGEEGLEKRWNSAIAAAEAAESFFRRRRLFFDPEACEMVERVFEIMRSAHTDFAVSRLPQFKEGTEKWVSADTQMREALPPVLSVLAERFRAILKA